MEGFCFICNTQKIKSQGSGNKVGICSWNLRYWDVGSSRLWFNAAVLPLFELGICRIPRDSKSCLPLDSKFLNSYPSYFLSELRQNCMPSWHLILWDGEKVLNLETSFSSWQRSITQGRIKSPCCPNCKHIFPYLFLLLLQFLAVLRLLWLRRASRAGKSCWQLWRRYSYRRVSQMLSISKKMDKWHRLRLWGMAQLFQASMRVFNRVLLVCATV